MLSIFVGDYISLTKMTPNRKENDNTCYILAFVPLSLSLAFINNYLRRAPTDPTINWS
jgi:hypothetical protein